MLCPHCHQPLANPDDRFCPSCGGELTPPSPPSPEHPAAPPPSAAPPPLPPAPVADASALPPGAGAAPAGGTPWEQRAQIGFANALVETTKGVLTEPARFFREMPKAGGPGEPLLYGVILGYLGALAANVYQYVWLSVAGGGGGLPLEGPLAALAPFLQPSLGGLAFQALFGAIFVAIGIFVAAGILHLFLLLFGGARAGFEATLRVVCYASAADLLLLVPLCGSFVWIVYKLVLETIGLSEAHGISRATAAAAVLLPIVLLCCCCGVLGALMGAGIASLMPR